MKLKTLLLLAIVSTFFFLGCSNSMDNAGLCSVQFGAKDIESTETRGPIASGATKMHITIEVGGIPKNLDLKLFTIGTEMISESIMLAPGSYQLTQFILLDDENALYATPVSGSGKAHLVSTPLPIDFIVSNGATTVVSPEVVKIGNSTAGEFGYTGFDFQMVDTFDFAVEIQIPTSGGFVSTGAELTVENSGNLLYSNSLTTGLNIVEVNDGYTDYDLTISKDGYVIHNVSYNQTQLKDFINVPLLVTLTPSSTVISSIHIQGAHSTAGGGASFFYWHKITSNGSDAGAVSDSSNESFYSTNIDLTMPLTTNLTAGDYFTVVWGGSHDDITRTFTFNDQSSDAVTTIVVTEPGTTDSPICRNPEFSSPDTYYRFYFNGATVTHTKINL